MTKLSLVASGALLLAGLRTATAEALTPKHEVGRCAIRDHCGSKSFFGGQLPCLDNGPAAEPDDKLRKLLVDVCGPKWETGPVCCSNDQVCRWFLMRLLQDGLARVAARCRKRGMGR